MWENVPKQMYRERARNKVIIHSTLNTTLASLQALTLVAIDDVVANEVPQAWGALALLTRTGSSPFKSFLPLPDYGVRRPEETFHTDCTTSPLNQHRMSSFTRKNQTRTSRLPASSRSAFSASLRPLPKKSRAAGSFGASSCSIAGQLRRRGGSECSDGYDLFACARVEIANPLHVTVSLFRVCRFRGDYRAMTSFGAARCVCIVAFFRHDSHLRN